MYRGTQTNYSNTLLPMDEITCRYILIYLDCTKYNEKRNTFLTRSKHKTNRIWYVCGMASLQSPTKGFGYILVTMAGNY